MERHFRVRGPLLAYHVFEHVPLPLRRKGDLRGSYYRVVVLGGERLLACVEDLSAWWGVRESLLPYLTLGLRGFDLDVDMADLERHIEGSHKDVARQTLAYLDDFEEHRREQAVIDEAHARQNHAAALAAVNQAVAEQHRARLDRRERIIRAFQERPDLTVRAAQAEFNASAKYLVELRTIAVQRNAGGTRATLPASQGAT